MTNPVDRATDAIAAAAVTSPIWHDWILTMSASAGVLLPILGCIWLVVQIYYKWRRKGD